jgi:hypothetical protein
VILALGGGKISENKRRKLRFCHIRRRRRFSRGDAGIIDGPSAAGAASQGFRRRNRFVPV